MTTYTLDIECYPNFFLVCVASLNNGTYHYDQIVLHGEEARVSTVYKHDTIIHKLKNLLKTKTHTFVTFNGNNYDIPVLSAALANKPVRTLYKMTVDIIEREQKPWNVMRKYGVEKLRMNHIDLFWTTPLKGSLKIYGGRLHTKKLQSLPIEPGSYIREEDIWKLIEYCLNDCVVTREIYDQLDGEVKLRGVIGDEIGMDLRSASDAQVGERVLMHYCGFERKKITGYRGKPLSYQVPKCIQFETPSVCGDFSRIASATYEVLPSGALKRPDELKEDVVIGDMSYRVGVGGLHSTEKKLVVHSDQDVRLEAWDVTSYYPNIILNERFAPKDRERVFLKQYGILVGRRVAAKRKGDRVQMDSLRIAINGCFGKFGSIYSPLFDPQLLLQVTVTGQLQLLMMIEMLESIDDVSVVSANTDGLIVRYETGQEKFVRDARLRWEKQTNHNMEVDPVRSLFARDVNNYVLVNADGSTKRKGAFTDQAKPKTILWKNPTNEICTESAVNFLLTGQLPQNSIDNCEDVRKFLTLRTVRGGAEYDFEPLGSAIRWYYSNDPMDDCIRRCDNGGKVPRSQGAVPLMNIDNYDEIPLDLDYEWYYAETEKIIKDLGVAI